MHETVDESGEYDADEYEVVSFAINWGVISVLMAIPPFLFGIIIDNLPALIQHSRQWIYVNWAFNTMLGLMVAGIVAGLASLRSPRTRKYGLLGFLVNALILALYGLYIYFFRWILTR